MVREAREHHMEDLATAVNTPKKVFLRAENENCNKTGLEEQPNITFNITSLPGSSTSSLNSELINVRSLNFFWQLSVAGFKLQYIQETWNKTHKCFRSQMGSWSLQKIEELKSNNQTNASFAEAILNKMKGCVDKPAPVRQRKLDMGTKVINDEVYFGVMLVDDTGSSDS